MFKTDIFLSARIFIQLHQNCKIKTNKSQYKKIKQKMFASKTKIYSAL